MSEQIEKGNKPETMEDIARRNFEMWNEALQTGDPKKVAELYAEALFMPTFSDEIKEGRSGAEEYFTHFLKKNPTCEIVSDKIQADGTDRYTHLGYYNFTINAIQGREVIEAKFMFNWKKNEQGKWIMTAHGSAIVSRPKPEDHQEAVKS